MSINIKDKDREIEILTKDGKKLKGHVLFFYEDAGYQLIFYVVDDLVYAQKIQEDGTTEDLLDDELEVAEEILEAYFKENQLEDEEEDIELDLEKN